MHQRQLSWSARTSAFIAAMALCNAVHADDAPSADTALKTQLELQKLKTEVQQDRADLYRSLVPDLATAKREAPDAPKVEATTTQVAFTQANALALRLAADIRQHATGGKLLLDSPHILAYLSAAESVQGTLKVSTEAVRKSTADLQNTVELVNKLPAKSGAGQTGGSRQLLGIRIAPAAILALPALVETGFAIASALKTSYRMDGTRHDDLSTKVLQASVIAGLSKCVSQPHGQAPAADSTDAVSTEAPAQCTRVVVYDADAFLPPSASAQAAAGATALPGTKTAADLLLLTNALTDASGPLRQAQSVALTLRRDAEPSDPKGQKDAYKVAQAEVVEAQAKILAGVVAAGEAYRRSLYAPGDSGVAPLVAAARGEWLQGITGQPAKVPRLSISSLVAATDIVAADGWIKGLRISVAGNTIAQWRLTFPDGEVRTGVAQSCRSQSNVACMPKVLRPD